MALKEHLLASANVNGDYGRIYVTYDDVDLQIYGVTAEFTGAAHFKLGNPDAPRRITINLDEPVTVDLSHGKKYYLEDTTEGLELPADLNMYFEVNLQTP